MGSLLKTFAAAAVGLAAFGFTAASAEHDDGPRYQSDRSRPDRCDVDHDHRAHNADYYDYFDEDRYSRGGAYRGVSVSIGVGGRGERGYGDRNDDYGYGDRYDDRRGDRFDDRYNDRYNGQYDGRRPRSRVVQRKVFRSGYGAQIILIEQVYLTRRGYEQRVCTVQARGRDAHHVTYGQLRRIAAQNCSRRADVRVLR